MTRIELLVRVAIAGILISIGVGSLSSCTSDKSKADASAREYMQHVPGATGYECVATDSDNDGYCSCTIFRGSADPLPVVCGCQRLCIINCASGCKYTPFAGGRR